jgi:threonyl-tRNA synthetase
MPEKFDLFYVGEDGQKHRPAVIHRVIYGSIERFFAVLIEHFAGAFPVWLAPLQVLVVPITDRHHLYAATVLSELNKVGVRAEVDERSEKVGYKIREAQLQKVPYMLIVGDKETEAGQVSVRKRSEGDVGSVSLAEFVATIKEEIVARRR